MKIDSFSGAAADLKGHARTPDNVREALLRNPRVSVWDMESAWLRGCLDSLLRQGLIVEIPASYPWVAFRVIPIKPTDQWTPPTTTPADGG